MRPGDRTCVAVVAGLLFIGAGIKTPARADSTKAEALLTLSGESALRDLLGTHVVLVTVSPRPQQFQDPLFLSKRFGMGVRTRWKGQTVLLTSLALVQEADRVEVSRVGGSLFAPAKVSRLLEKEGLAVLECLSAGKAPCDSPPASLALPGAADPDRTLVFLVPASAGRSVVSSTVTGGQADPTLDGLIVITGEFLQGTPLFDAKGRVAAIVVRAALGGPGKSLATVLVPLTGPDGESVAR